jgi:FKBP-type peptidyl-prolyl cis-trans isomerase FkpA
MNKAQLTKLFKQQKFIYITLILATAFFTGNAQTAKKAVAKKKTTTTSKKAAAGVTKLPLGYKVTAQGALYRILKPHVGARIKLNDVITFQVIQKTGKDSVLFSSYNTGKPVKLQVQASQNVGDLMQVFQVLTNQDSAIVKIPTDLIFKGNEQQRPPFLAKGSSLVFLIKIERVQALADALAERNAEMTKMKEAEMAALQNYVNLNKLTANSTASGLKYVITAPSAQAKPMPGDTVLVNYTGKTLDGKVFDSSVEANAKAAGLQQPGRTYEPIKVVVGQGQVIKGWDEGLLLLPEGSKAILLIPSDLGYGAQGAGADIKPYSTLIFDMELVKIIKAKTAATPADNSGIKH